MKRVKVFFTYLLVLCSLSLGNGVMAEALFHVCRCDADAVSTGVSCCGADRHCEMEPAEPVASSCCGASSHTEECPVFAIDGSCSQCVYLPVWFNSIDIDASFSLGKVEVEEPIQPLVVVLTDGLVPEHTTPAFSTVLLSYSIQPSCMHATVQLRL